MTGPAFVSNRPKLPYSTAATLVIGVLVLSMAKTGGDDLETHNEIVSLLRQLKQLDAEWNADVLRSLVRSH